MSSPSPGRKHAMRFVVLVPTLLVTLGGQGLSAQRRLPWPSPATPLQAPSLEGATVASGLAGGASLLLVGLDRQARGWAQHSSVQDSRLVHRIDDAFRWLGGDLPKAGAAAVWLTGLALGDDGTAGLGRDVGEALIAATVTTGVIKRLAGRARPYVEPHDAHDFRAAGGFGSRDRRSFPSGHATSAFALAAALTAAADEAWGEGAYYVAVPTGAMATVTAISRVVDDEHWLSDVVGGAGVGVFAAVLVMRANGY